MKKQKLMVQRMAKNVSLMRQDLRSDYPMNYLAEKELSTLVKKVSPQLYGMLVHIKRKDSRVCQGDPGIARERHQDVAKVWEACTLQN